MIKGITQKEYQIILEILQKYPGEFYLYGSRVKGDFDELSDLDILIKSKNCNNYINKLKEDFDNSSLPYIVNFTDYQNIDKNFYNLIKNDLVKI